MNIIRKDATITNTDDDDFPGTFEVVLSTSAKDRDGDELSPNDWQQPLPDHITFDVDHGMSVEKTIGSGVPSLEDGKLLVRGTYSSLPRAQEVRTLVREGHIRTTSVAFSSHKTTKDGKTHTMRELLNGAFVAIPSNTEAVVLSAKAGARNSGADAKQIQSIHDATASLGAACGPMDDTGATEEATGGKSAQDADTKALGDDAAASMNLSGQVAGFSINISAWDVPADELDGWTDTAQRALTAALELCAAGPVEDDEATDTQEPSEETTPNAEKSADADALELQMLALRVITASHFG